MNAIKQFWDEQALAHGTSDLATAPDHFYRELEIREILKHLHNDEWVLDAGCGNGYSTRIFRDKINSEFIGIDYSEKMIEQAKKLERKCLFFMRADVRDLSPLYKRGFQFDTAVSERCLINLTTWDEQKAALLEIKKCLKPDGRIILVENFMEGLKNLNGMRSQFDLHEIKTRWHNRYLVWDEFMPFAREHFTIDHQENIGNLYYIISRVVYAALAKADDREPEYGHLINKIAAQLPTLGNYPFSPNYLFILRNK